MMMRSKGNSKIIGAVIAAMAPLVSRTHGPRGVATKTTRNRTTAAVIVTGVMGSAAATWVM